jgi:hypothetical protein
MTINMSVVDYHIYIFCFVSSLSLLTLDLHHQELHLLILLEQYYSTLYIVIVTPTTRMVDDFKTCLKSNSNGGPEK